MIKNRITFDALLGLMILISVNAYSQSGKVPPFRMVTPDSNVFKAENLPMGKPIVMIYFSPGCEECDQLTEEILSNTDELAKASVVMITYLSLEEVMQFVSKYNLDKYQNIYVGTEMDTYFVGRYYNVQQIPFIALYNKNGDLKMIYNIYNKGIIIKDLTSRLRNL